MREGGGKKKDVASAQHNLTTKLPLEMKNALTSQQNMCPTVRVDTNASAREGTKKSHQTERNPALYAGLNCLVDLSCKHIVYFSRLSHPKRALLAALLTPVVDVCLQGREVGLRVGPFSAGGSLWHHLVCRLVGTHTNVQTHGAHAHDINFHFYVPMVPAWPPTSSWTSLSLPTHTHTCIC